MPTQRLEEKKTLTAGGLQTGDNLDFFVFFFSQVQLWVCLKSKETHKMVGLPFATLSQQPPETLALIPSRQETHAKAKKKPGTLITTTHTTSQVSLDWLSADPLLLVCLFVG